ncbi:hypothetical protein KBB27_02800 [Patescibacteria group bacterium]|nr:hypothetical protein [Patescibacteria group bacterium]
MPFDAAPSFERPVTTNVPETVVPRKETTTLNTSTQRGETPQPIRPDRGEFDKAQRLLDGFLAYTKGLNTLSGDQKNLLERLRNDPRAEQLDEVVYTDPSTGTQHRFREYFQGDTATEQVLNETNTVLQKYQEAFSRENNIHTGDWYKPQSPEKFLAQLDERNNPRDVKIREGWEEYNNKFQDHMKKIQERLNQPLGKLPTLEELKARREARSGAPAPVQEAIPSQPAPQSFVEAQPVVMPQAESQAPQKKSLFARVKKWFG